MTIPIPAAVSAGEAVMDAADPGWWREDALSLEALDMEHGDTCVLGQRCPDTVLAAWLGRAPGDGDREARRSP